MKKQPIINSAIKEDYFRETLIELIVNLNSILETGETSVSGVYPKNDVSMDYKTQKGRIKINEFLSFYIKDFSQK